jgi:DMSO/TMAO reductase YedYZ molybdopterin-dependent catalytic subunit
VCFYSYDDWADSLDMLDALHPQTLLAYGMNGRDLSIPGGAPLRLRVATQLGYKSMKYLERVVVKDDFDDGGDKGNTSGMRGSERSFVQNAVRYSYEFAFIAGSDFGVPPPSARYN